MCIRDRKYFLLLIFTFQISNSILAQDQYFIIWDKYASAPGMAENLLTVHRMISDFENKNIKSTYWDETKRGGKALGIGFRFVKTALFDLHIDFLLHTNQHLLFGSGYRLREFGFRQNRYNIFLFPPYGYGGGFARKGNVQDERRLGAHESLLLEFGGMEAVTVMSQKLKDKWVRRGSINYRESLLYLSTLYEGTAYFLIADLFPNIFGENYTDRYTCLLYTSPSPRDATLSRMPSSA